ncbi:MAG TPA: CHAD domain-containing protein [Opitutus sp.]|nr:CHAD domain-containing protein [Opitutus sp.]
MARSEYQDDLPHLRRREAIGAGLRRVVRECCGRAMQRGAGAPTDEAVHAARRGLKRARAALRLEEKLGVPDAHAARKRLSAIARELSARRDATVAAHVARRLGLKLEGVAGRERVAAPNCVSSNGDAAWWRAWRQKLAAEDSRLPGAEGEDSSPAAVRGVLHHFAKRVCRRARRAAEKRDIGSMHEWRKAVIVLREQLHIVRPLLEAEELCLGGKLHKLARRLGKATDYNVLKRQVESGGDGRAVRRRLRSAAMERRGRAMRKAREKWPKVRRALRKRF